MSNHPPHSTNDTRFTPRAPGAATVRVLAPAKLNLSLAVGAPYPIGHPKAGFHPIASWFVAIDLADSLEVAALPGGRASSFDIAWADDAPQVSPIDWPLDKDLLYRAHASAERAGGRELPVRAVLRKRVPVGGGCGGGSSDAAAMLIALARLFPGVLADTEWVRLGGSLGSDVTFFLDEQRLGVAGDDLAPRPAIVWGVGEYLERLPRSGEGTRVGEGAGIGMGVWLVVPPFGCPTGKVYGAFDRGIEAATHDVAGLERRVREGVARALVRGRVEDGDLFNDLAGPACAVEPRLGELLSRVRAAGFHAHVTGSGSTVFVLRSEDRAEEGRLRAACGAGVTIVASTTL